MIRQQNYKKSAKDRDYKFTKNNHTYKRCVKVINQNINETSYYNTFYHINRGVIQEFPALRKAITTHVKKKSYFFTYVDIANQLLTRHSPLAPLGQVDE